MNGIDFIKANPATQAFDHRQRRDEDSRRSGLAAERQTLSNDRARGEMQREATQDKVLSNVISPPAPKNTTAPTHVVRSNEAGQVQSKPAPQAAPAPQQANPAPNIRTRAANALAGAGQGRAALNLITEADDKSQARSDQQFDAMVNALAQDRPEVALQIAQRAGMNNPDFAQAVQHSWFRREFAARYARNKATYKNPQLLEKQTQRDLVELLGRMRGAEPNTVPAPDTGGQRIMPEAPSGNNFVGAPFPGADNLMYVRTKDGRAIPLTGPDGQPVQARPQQGARDPNQVSALQFQARVDKQVQTLLENDYTLRNRVETGELPYEALYAQVAQRMQQALRQAGGTGNALDHVYATPPQAAPAKPAPEPEGPGFLSRLFNYDAPRQGAPANVPSVRVPVPPSNGAELPRFSRPEDVKAEYRAGRIDRATAQQILQSQFGMIE